MRLPTCRTELSKSLMFFSLSFVPTSRDSPHFELLQDFDEFWNKLCDFQLRPIYKEVVDTKRPFSSLPH